MISKLQKLGIIFMIYFEVSDNLCFTVTNKFTVSNKCILLKYRVLVKLLLNQVLLKDQFIFYVNYVYNLQTNHLVEKTGL